MRVRIILGRWALLSLLVGAILPLPCVIAEDTLSDIQQRIDTLEKEAAQTTDLNRLLEIAGELTELATRLQQSTGAVPTVSPVRGKTPDEEINREIQAINSAYERQKIAFTGYRDESAEPVPFLSARKLHGSIEVRGGNQRLSSEAPYEGGVFRTLHYTIREDFVGYLVTAEYYDPKAGRFTAKKDYRLRTISRKIHPPVFGGRECVKTAGNDGRTCRKWEPYASYRIVEGDTYPAIHDWTVGGTPEGDEIVLEVETPDIVFSTAQNGRSRSQGCFGAEIRMSNADLEAGMADDKLTAHQSVGGEFRGTPHCGKGSTVAVTMDLCREVPRCRHLESLLAKVLWAVGLRDRYGAASKVAGSEEELHTLVNLDLNDRYPNLDIQDRTYLEENAGGYNIHTGETLLPDLCKGCATMPLCMWDREGLRMHEKTHELDVLADPLLKKLFTDTQYQMENYTANELGKAQARAWGEMDYHAYDENARYLMDILQRELSGSSGCSFPPEFYTDLDKALNALE